MELTMAVRDARRLGIVEAAVRGKITNAQGAEALKLSPRQFKRLRRRVQREGAGGILHRNRGRPSPRRLAGELRARVLALMLDVSVRLNDCHIADLLTEQGYRLSPATVRRVRVAEKVPPKHRRRPPRHHRRREREAQEGALVLIDGSPFAWLGPEQPTLCLVGTLDDATGKILSLTLHPHEDLHAFTLALRDLLSTHGVPLVLYGDGTGIAVRTDDHWSLEEELQGRQHPTQFGQMLEELGIRYIRARSPEAKGRIERLWRTLQDRLAAELALQGITTLEAALAYLPDFIARYNRRFAATPRQPAAVWQRPPRHLDLILACRYPRTVARDNTVAFFGTTLQLPPGPQRRSYHQACVEVRELLDGRLRVLYQGRALVEQPASPGPFTLVPRDSERGRRRPRRQNHAPGSSRIADRTAPRVPGHACQTSLGALTPIPRPAKNHPWRRPFKPNPCHHTAGNGG